MAVRFVLPRRARHTVIRMRALIPLLLLTGCGLPALSSEDVFGLEESPRAWVYGTVADAKSGGPLANVTVQLAANSAQSDANGAFRIEGLTAGNGELAASREGFEPLGMPLLLRAGGNRLELKLVPLACGSCREDEICDPAAGKCVQPASLSGDLVDICTGAAVAARITVDGHSTCSLSGKGFWQLKGLKPGGPQTLAAGRTGYQAFSMQVTLVSGFNAIEKISLTPIGGCTAPPPVESVCSCTTPGCQ
jgi:hypothetical protein